MFVSFNDVKSRINEQPTWYTKHGYPRYGDFAPFECNVYARYSILVSVKCQSCHLEMFIGQDFTSEDIYTTSIPKELVGLTPPEDNPEDFQEVPLHVAVYLPGFTSDFVKKRTIEEILLKWGMGDPPSHGCVGDTMGCIEHKIYQVWDRNHGQVVENGIITTWGVPTRLTHLEGHLFDDIQNGVGFLPINIET